MSKQRKNVKRICRLKEVSQDKLDKLYLKIPFPCIDCQHDCKGMVSDIEDCPNRVQRESINELIEMIKEEQVDLIRLCDTYDIKFDYLLRMLRGEEILCYKYYWIIKNRLHMVKDSEEINKEYNTLYNHKEVGVGV